MNDLLKRAKEIRDEVRIGRNTASRVGGLLVDIAGQVEGTGVFVPLGGIPLAEFNDLTEPGYYTYSLQEGTGEINGILVVSKHGHSITSQIRYENGDTYRRTLEDEGWTKWCDPFISKLKKYIDNDSIYWDEPEQVIKARGGGTEVETFVITAGINPSNIGQCRVEATGDVVGVESSSNGGSYTITVLKGGTVTVHIIPADGYQVERLNVDQAPQGAISGYVFTAIEDDHTMYVWMEEAVEMEVAADFLERSDLPGTYYSSLHSAMTAVKADYPEKLTQDITIKCIKECTEYRDAKDPDKVVGDRIWTAVLDDWNKGGAYSLIIDGDNAYTLSAYSLGGVFLKYVDNVIFKNMDFIDYSNFMKGSSPEEMAGIYSLGKIDDKNKNIAVINCRFNGSCVSASGTGYAWYGLDTKLTSNIIVDNCTFVKGGAKVFKCTDADILEITRTSIDGQFVNSVAHSNLIYCTGAKKVVLDDCLLNGHSMNEYAIGLSNVDALIVRRSHFTNIEGQPFSIAGTSKLDASFESCLFESCLKAPKFQYCRFIAYIEQAVGRLAVRNCTFYMDGAANFQQIFSVTSDTGEIVNYNNIFIDKSNKLNAVFVVSGALGAYKAGNNLYKAVQHSSGDRFNAMSVLDNSLVAFDKRSLARFQAAGYETGSAALRETEDVVNVENGGTGYALLTPLNQTYQADTANVPVYDIDYKLTDYKPTIGAYNLNGDAWDESADPSGGYSGLHIADAASFDNSAQYTLPSDDLALLAPKCEDRRKFIRTSIYSADHTIMRYGRNVLFSLECKMDEATGAYMEDVEYSVKIEKL